MNHIETTIAAIRSAYPEAVQDVKEFRGETTVVLRAGALLDVCRLLRDDGALAYTVLADLAAVDYWPDEPRFAVSYLPFAMQHNTRLRLKVFLPGEAPEVDTVSAIWPSANWQEREAYDLMGIRFVDHPDLRRILMPADWEGHPHRKDYPLGYEEVQFSFNKEEIDKRKKYAES
ncbi:MAG: NADH-quinone oxidoreductase subunit C [Anaerolineales bacterium]